MEHSEHLITMQKKVGTPSRFAPALASVLLPDTLQWVDWGRDEGNQKLPGFIEHVLQQT